MNLIIVESPTKARTLSRFLGNGYAVEATVGHIKDLPKSKLGVDIENNFEPDYQVISKQKRVISSLKKEAKKAEVVFIATDPDREGEAIAQHVEETLAANGQRTTAGKIRRIEFHEITKNAVEHAIAHPRDVDDNLVNSQIARRVLDRLVGYKLSPLLWRKVRRGLSAGRVQSVVVRLIVEREREIEAFKPIEFWEISAIVATSTKHRTRFTVRLVKIADKKAEVRNKEQADKIIADLEKAEYKVSEIKRREIKSNPYPPFTTSTMTQSAANVFGWSAKRTMSTAQKLYEQGLITYHRTDSTNLSAAALSMAREYIKREFGDKYLPERPRIYKTKSKSAQEAHEAIRPTDVTVHPEKLRRGAGRTPNTDHSASRLYELIWKRLVASQMNPAVYDRTTIDVAADEYLLRAVGQIVKFDGWRKLSSAKNNTPEVLIPDVSENDPLSLIKVLSEQKFTQPPPRYNEASLVKTLEKLGIGRPSTYAPTISTIQARAYVEKEDRKFYPTSVGVAVNDYLMDNFPETLDYAFTAKLESNLDGIAGGGVKWNKEIEDFWKPFEKKLEKAGESARVKIAAEKLGRACPECGAKHGGELVIRTGRFGKFISCGRFPECKHTEKYLEKIGLKCPKCAEKGRLGDKQGDVIVKKTGKGRKFFGCSRYPDCDFASWKKPKAAT